MKNIDFDSGYTMTIDGNGVDSDARFHAIDPATGKEIASVPDASREQLDDAVVAARKAFAAWSATPLPQRQAAVAALAGHLMANQESLARLLTREQGKPLADARLEIATAAYWCVEFAKLAPATKVLADTPASRVEVRRLPLGVVAAIVPWNFPVILAFWKIVPALIAGNTLVVKPSPFTPLTTLKIGELLRDALPAGVLNVISGGDELGPWISAHPGIDKISFTGSTATGRKIMASAAANLKRLTLELGGNDAAIVTEDVDVDAIAPILFRGAFANSAQFCMAIKRLYVHEAVYDALAGKLAQLARSARLGRGDADEVQFGPVQNRPLYERLGGLLADCRAHGYRFLAGGEVDPAAAGNFVPLTLIDDPPDSARVVAEEAFGPILPLLKFRGDEEAVARANASEYGLGASVWCRDEARALALAARLEAGTVWVNELHTLSPLKPMAGHKQSGVGVENGEEGLLEYTIPQTISITKAALAA